MANAKPGREMTDMINRWMGHGGSVSIGPYKPIEKMIAAFEMTRPLLSTMGPPLAGAAAVLSISSIPSIPKIIFGSLAVIIAAFGIHTFNDWVDRERDKQAWPMRAIPTGRIQPKTAFILSMSYFIIAITMTYFLINSTTSLILFIALFLGCLYCLRLRDKIGYLSLPFIIGLFPIGGWTAFSPKTLFHSPMPWILFAMAWLWQAGHIMVHSAGHPVKEINGKRITETKGFFFSTTPAQAAILGLVFLILTFVLSITIYFISPLGYLYLALSIISAIYVIVPAYKLLKNPENKAKSLTAFNAASNYLIMVNMAIIIDIFVQTVLWKYLASPVSILRTHLGLWLWPVIFAALATIIGFLFLAIFILKEIINYSVQRRKRNINSLVRG